jgi:hypothetical protein
VQRAAKRQKRRHHGDDQVLCGSGDGASSVPFPVAGPLCAGVAACCQAFCGGLLHCTAPLLPLLPCMTAGGVGAGRRAARSARAGGVTQRRRPCPRLRLDPAPRRWQRQRPSDDWQRRPPAPSGRGRRCCGGARSASGRTGKTQRTRWCAPCRPEPQQRPAEARPVGGCRHLLQGGRLWPQRVDAWQGGDPRQQPAPVDALLHSVGGSNAGGRVVALEGGCGSAWSAAGHAQGAAVVPCGIPDATPPWALALWGRIAQ